MIAGATGGLTAIILKKLIDFKYWSKYTSKESKYKYKTSYDYNTQIGNPLSRYDLFIIGRGIIAGSILVSAPGIYYKLWISAILGMIGGLIYIASCLVMQKFKIDDPMNVFSVHGLPALISLILIVCFHSDYGIFFTKPNDIVTSEKLD